MRTCALILALGALPLHGPAHASGIAAARVRMARPIVRMAQANPQFRSTLIGLIQETQGLPSLELPALTAAQPLSIADLAVDAQAEAAQAILLSYPHVLAAGREELGGILGPDTVARLTSTAEAVQRMIGEEPDSDLAKNVARIQQVFALPDTADIEGLGTRLAEIFDNFGTHGNITLDVAPDAPSVVAGPGLRQPLVRLRRSEPEAETASEGPEKIVVSPAGMKMAQFGPGEYTPEHDARLKALGVHTVLIENPTRAEIDTYDEPQGFFLQPRWIAWMARAQSLEDYIAAFTSGNRRQKLKKALKTSKDVRVELAPLTVEDFEEWWPIYRDEIGGKPGGRIRVKQDWARRELAKRGSLKNDYRVFYYDPEDGSLLGGAILYVEPERGFAGGAWAAYRRTAKERRIDLGPRMIPILLELAAMHNVPVIAEGKDTNFYGLDYNPGLMVRKAMDGMSPFPGAPFGLLKILDPSAFTGVNYGQHRAGVMFYSLKREGLYYDRYLAALDAGETPNTVELMGGEPYYGPDKPSPDSILELNHFYVDADSPPPAAPMGIDVIRRPLQAANP